MIRASGPIDQLDFEIEEWERFVLASKKKKQAKHVQFAVIVFLCFLLNYLSFIWGSVILLIGAAIVIYQICLLYQDIATANLELRKLRLMRYTEQVEADLNAGWNEFCKENKV